MLRNISFMAFAAVLFLNLAIAQEKPQKMETQKKCKKECCANKDTEKAHPADCKCEKCEAHAKMDHSMMDAKKMMDKKHPENCDCKMCKAHANMDSKKECDSLSQKPCCNKSEDDEKTVTIWNKFCPVRGGEVDPETPTVEYNGKTIGFCCPGCDDKFSKDPEKYMKNLSEDGQEFMKKS